MEILKIFKRREFVVNHKVCWHRYIPFVIAEIKNREWEKINEVLNAKKKFSGLFNMCNKNGNWYILEGLDYYWFDLRIFTNTDKEILYNDSMHLRFNGLTDKEKSNTLIKVAKEDIDAIWSCIFKKLKLKK